jgi:hypothetical protein
VWSKVKVEKTEEIVVLGKPESEKVCMEGAN